MKYLQTPIALLIVCAAVGFAFSQNKNGKAAKPLEIKANVAVLDAAGKLADGVRAEDLKIFEDGVEQKITYFVKKQPAMNLGLVFDNTGSIRLTLDEILKNLNVFTDYLSDRDEAFVVRFVSSEKITVDQDWTSDKRRLHEAMKFMYVEGGKSAVLDAVYLSAQKVLEREKTDRSKRHAVILVSDAEDRDSYYKLKDIEKLFNDTDLQIFVISFAESAPKHKKKSRYISNILTLRTGGTTYTIPEKFTENDITGAVKNIMGELRSQYIVGYVSTNPKRDGLQRKLAVQVADGAGGEKRQGIVRDSFIVPKD